METAIAAARRNVRGAASALAVVYVSIFLGCYTLSQCSSPISHSQPNATQLSPLLATSPHFPAPAPAPAPSPATTTEPTGCSPAPPSACLCLRLPSSIYLSTTSSSPTHLPSTSFLPSFLSSYNVPQLSQAIRSTQPTLPRHPVSFFCPPLSPAPALKSQIRVSIIQPRWCVVRVRHSISYHT